MDQRVLTLWDFFYSMRNIEKYITTNVTREISHRTRRVEIHHLYRAILYLFGIVFNP